MADLGTGASITFGTTGFSAEVMAINGNEITRAVVNSSHLGTTTAHTKLFGDLYDPGEVQLEINFDPDEQPPIGSAAETITVTFPVPAGMTNGATCAGTGAVTGWSWGVPLEDKMTATVTVTFSGALAWTDAS